MSSSHSVSLSLTHSLSLSLSLSLSISLSLFLSISLYFVFFLFSLSLSLSLSPRSHVPIFDLFHVRVRTSWVVSFDSFRPCRFLISGPVSSWPDSLMQKTFSAITLRKLSGFHMWICMQVGIFIYRYNFLRTRIFARAWFFPYFCIETRFGFIVTVILILLRREPLWLSSWYTERSPKKGLVRNARGAESKKGLGRWERQG